MHTTGLTRSWTLWKNNLRETPKIVTINEMPTLKNAEVHKAREWLRHENNQHCTNEIQTLQYIEEVYSIRLGYMNKKKGKCAKCKKNEISTGGEYDISALFALVWRRSHLPATLQLAFHVCNLTFLALSYGSLSLSRVFNRVRFLPESFYRALGPAFPSLVDFRRISPTKRPSSFCLIRIFDACLNLMK